MLDLLALSVVHADNSWINFDVNALFQNFWSATFDGLTFGGAVYGLIAVGYTLVYGVLSLINFAHSEVFIVGAYGVVVTLTTLGFGPSAPTIGPAEIIMDLLLALIVGMLASAVTAFLVERVAYRPLRKRNAPRLAFLITAIGVSFAIQYIIFLPFVGGANAQPAVTMFIPDPSSTSSARSSRTSRSSSWSPRSCSWSERTSSSGAAAPDAGSAPSRRTRTPPR